jgi:predicted nucleic acid-binding protein
MPGPFAIDASVFLNAFLPAESGSETSKELLAQLQSQAIPIIAPFLFLTETAAAISRGQNDTELARQFAGALQRLPHLVLIPLDQVLARQAVDIAASHRLRGSDAIYAAVAQRFACPLVTLDREQHDRAAGLLQTFYPANLLDFLNSSR